MFVAIRYMQDEMHAIAEAIGGFDTLDAAETFIAQHWDEYDQYTVEAFELTSPQGYGQ